MADKNIISVTQLNEQAKSALESLPSVWVQGEVSNLSIPASGHWYFTLKDAKAQVRCAMFRGRNLLSRAQVNNGDSVVVNGNISLYEGRGDYQLIIESLQKAGLGGLHEQLEALKAKLAAEGLFETEDKQPLPLYPQTIGIISSPTGAAVHDMLTVLRRRYPLAEVIIYPAVVQGAEAPLSLRKALAIANAQDLCDVLIIGRGGGSLEDLWAFNDEHLAREVWSSGIPIVSAVGHEVDISLCDFVADLRAPTPSAAAEAITPNLPELRQTLATYEKRLCQLMSRRIKDSRSQLRYAQARIISPQNYVRQQQQRLDYLSLRLSKAWQGFMNTKRLALNDAQASLGVQSPRYLLEDARFSLVEVKNKLEKLTQRSIQSRQLQLQQLSEMLHALSPLQTLKRGYSITQTSEGKVISRAQDLSPQQRVQLRFRDGIALAQISDVYS